MFGSALGLGLGGVEVSGTIGGVGDCGRGDGLAWASAVWVWPVPSSAISSDLYTTSSIPGACRSIPNGPSGPSGLRYSATFCLLTIVTIRLPSTRTSRSYEAPIPIAVGSAWMLWERLSNELSPRAMLPRVTSSPPSTFDPATAIRKPSGLPRGPLVFPGLSRISRTSPGEFRSEARR